MTHLCTTELLCLVPLSICLEKARQPSCLLFHVFERPRLACRICVHPQRLRRSSASVRLGSRSKVLPECALPTVKFAVYFVVSGPGKAIALQAPREKVEVDMRHGLPRRATVLRGPISASDISKRKKKKKGARRVHGVME
jgi:hypothetical protein